MVDHTSQLMWQQSGSATSMTAEHAQDHIGDLNSRAYAGYSDWRIPTVEELASLLEPREINGYPIDPIFDMKGSMYRSGDQIALEPDVGYFVR